MKREETKYCWSCKTEKPVSLFHKSKATYDGFTCYCAYCRRKKNEVYKREKKSTSNMTNARRVHLKHKFNITPEQWDTQFEKQGRCCAVCNSPTPKSKRGWHTDHDHTTKYFRGILCQSCNQAIGYYEKILKPLWSNFQFYLHSQEYEGKTNERPTR